MKFSLRRGGLRLVRHLEVLFGVPSTNFVRLAGRLGTLVGLRIFLRQLNSTARPLFGRQRFRSQH